MGNDGIVCLVNQANENLGTGFFIADTLIVTCYHVISGASLTIGSELKYLKQGSPERFPAFVEMLDKSCDVATLRTAEKSNVIYKLKAVPFTHGQSLKTRGFPQQARELKRAEPTYIGSIDSNKIQLANSNSITFGFSGAPLFAADESNAIGMIRQCRLVKRAQLKKPKL